MTRAQHSTSSPAVRVFGLPLVVLCALQLMVVLDGTVVNLALPRLQAELSLSDAWRSWVITSYALSYGGLLLLGGRIGDAIGRRKAFLIGVGLFTAASLACGLASSGPLLILARVLQGAGAAIASPTAMALLVVTFPPGPARNKAFSVFAMMTGLGSVSGLIIGGALTEVSWRWIFFINVPIGALILVGGLAALPAVSGIRLALDVRGAVLATASCTLLVFGLTSLGEGAATVGVWIPTLLGVAGFILFLRSQRSATNPVMPLRLFSTASRTATFAALFLVGAALMAMTVQVAFYVQEVLGLSPLRAGLTFLPFAVGLGLGSAVASSLCLKQPPRFVITYGAMIVIAGFIWARSFDRHTAVVPTLLIAVLVIAFGLALVLIPLTLSVVAGVQPSDVGPLTALALVFQTLGGPIGLGLVTGVSDYLIRSQLHAADLGAIDREHLTIAQRDAFSYGYTNSLIVCAVLMGIMLIVVWWRLRFTVADIAEGKAAESAATALDDTPPTPPGGPTQPGAPTPPATTKDDTP